MYQQSTYIAVLDVGHGNSTVLVDAEYVLIVDAGPKNGLLDYLIGEGIKVIESIILSHADADHIAGLIGLLASGEFEIHEVRMNADSTKSSKIWDYLAYELTILNRNGKLRYIPTLTTNDNRSFDGPSIQIEVLAPDPYLITKGVGSTLRDGRRIESNTISAVIRLSSSDGPIVVLPGDIDDTGLDHLLSANSDLSAPILVFPHHGGRAGQSANIQKFAQKICVAVQPANVIFSIDRDRSNLQPEVIHTIREHTPNVRIACTQLHQKCSNLLPKVSPPHLNNKFAVGREKNRCCAGTMLIHWSGLIPLVDSHREFIVQNAPNALCINDTELDATKINSLIV